MDSISKNIFDLYKKKIINEAVGEEVPFSEPLKATKVKPGSVARKAGELKGQTAELAQQAQEPKVSADQIAAQAQPLVAGANKEAQTITQVTGDDPTSLVDIPRIGNNDLIAWKNTEFPEMSIAQIKMQVEAAYDLKKAFLLIGDPGQGKSSIVKQVGKQIAQEKDKDFVEWFDLNEGERESVIQNPAPYFVYVDMRLSEADKSEIAGIPVKADKPYTVYSRPQWAYLFSQPEADGILFLDEFNQGAPDVIDASFKIVLDRSLGDRRMAENVGIVAACNMGSIFGNDAIKPAAINRFGAGVLVADPETWRKYAVEAGIDETIIAFTKAVPEDALYKEPSDEGENPFVTPRQLENISDYIRYYRKKYDQYKARGRHFDALEQVRLAAAGRAGVPWANRFDTFLSHIQSFDMEKILKDPNKHLKNQPLDKSLALIVFVANKIKIAVQNAKAAGDQIQPNDKEIMTGIAKIMNNLSPEAVCVMFETLNKEMSKDLLTFLLDFVTYEEFDPAVKNEFLNEVMPQIRKIIKGDSCKSK